MKKNNRPNISWGKDFSDNKYIYCMLFPILAWYIIFHYVPMGGSVIAFQDYNPAKGFLKSNWVGFENFLDFFKGPYAWRLIKNTLLINIYQIVFGFPAPIILALLINEVHVSSYKRVVQTISYIPHFISSVVVCGLLVTFSRTDGLFNTLFNYGKESVNYLSDPSFFRTIYVSSDVWQGVGWGSIIYLASLSSIDPSLYEAAELDGCGRFGKIFHVTLPSLSPVIITLFIMRIGHLLAQGFEKIILLYNPLTYETADVLSTYVYRRGLIQMDFSFGSAVDIFNSVINVLILVLVNYCFKKKTEQSLW
ncbi:MAG: ABC transporter permease subunit [Sphaerochaetaceae bacterium]